MPTRIWPIAKSKSGTRAWSKPRDCGVFRIAASGGNLHPAVAGKRRAGKVAARGRHGEGSVRRCAGRARGSAGCGVRRAEPLRGPAAAQGDGRPSAAPTGHAVSRSHGQHGADQQRRPGCPGAGVSRENPDKGGGCVKKSTVLFTIEAEPYQVKLDQAKAAEDGAAATLKQAEAEYQRQSQLASRDFASKSALDQALATRDSAKSSLVQAKTNTRTAEINLSYTQVVAPFDGVVTAHLVSVGELVGTSPTQLATIVQLQPIYVNFNISEADVLRVRAELRRQGLTPADLKKIPAEVGLQSETGYPHKGLLDYAAPMLNTATGTLPGRALFPNTDRA